MSDSVAIYADFLVIRTPLELIDDWKSPIMSMSLRQSINKLLSAKTVIQFPNTYMRTEIDLDSPR